MVCDAEMPLERLHQTSCADLDDVLARRQRSERHLAKRRVFPCSAYGTWHGKQSSFALLCLLHLRGDAYVYFVHTRIEAITAWGENERDSNRLAGLKAIPCRDNEGIINLRLGLLLGAAYRGGKRENGER